MLLIGAALLIESVSNLRGIDVGFNPSHLLTMQVPLPPLRYDTNQKRASFFQELIRRVGSLPGVRGAAAAMSLPMMGYAGTPVQDASKPPLQLNERLIATHLDHHAGILSHARDSVAARKGLYRAGHGRRAARRHY